MPTARDLLELALFDAGIVGDGQTASAGTMDKAFARLNMMLAQWQVERWLVYRLETFGVVSTGAQSYTVGPGGDIDVAVRPDRVENAFQRQLRQSPPNQVDTPLGLIFSREDYNRLAVKQLTSFSSYLWYDNAYPQGRIYPWPIPQAAIYSIHISLKTVLSQFVNLADDVVLPNEYYNAIRMNMAVELRDAYDLPPKQVAVKLALKALSVIRGANAQVPRLTMPSGLTRPGIYNPYSDQLR